MTSQPRPSNWLVRFLSIRGKVSLAQDSSLTKDRFAFRKNFRSMSNFTKTSGMPNLIEENSGRNSVQFSEMSLYPGTHTSKTLVRHLERWSGQRLHSLSWSCSRISIEILSRHDFRKDRNVSERNTVGEDLLSDLVDSCHLRWQQQEWKIYLENGCNLYHTLLKKFFKIPNK